MAPLYQHFNRQKVPASMQASNFTKFTYSSQASNSTATNSGTNLILTQNSGTLIYTAWLSNTAYSPARTTTLTFNNVSQSASGQWFGLVFMTGVTDSSASFVYYLNGNGLEYGQRGSGWASGWGPSGATNVSSPAYQSVNGLRVYDDGTNITMYFSYNYGSTWTTMTGSGGAYPRTSRTPNLSHVGILVQGGCGTNYTIRSFSSQ